MVFEYNNNYKEKSFISSMEERVVGEKGEFALFSKELKRNCVERFWGRFVSIESGKGYHVKRLTLDVGKRISLQKHLHRSEHWVVVGGIARVVLDDDEIVLRSGQSTYVSVGVIHRLENMGRIPLEVIEVQVGEYLGEDDVERFDDDFDRVDFGEEEFCAGEGCGEED